MNSIPKHEENVLKENVKVDFHYFIQSAIQKKIAWKALGNLFEKMVPTLSEYKQLVEALLSELETLHQTKQIDIQLEDKKVPENEIKKFECDICNRLFKTKTGIIGHRKTHMTSTKKKVSKDEKFPEKSQ